MYANRTAFDELGLADTAGEREVKAAWRRLVSQWHPDRNDSVDAVAHMQRINRAFDAIREAGFRNPVNWSPYTEAPRQPPHAEPGPAAPKPRRQADPQPQQQQDRQAHADTASAHAQDTAAPEADAEPRKPIARRVRLSLEEAACGCVKVLRGKTQQRCDACDGRGHAATALRCTACRGSGQVRQHYFGWPGTAQACESCAGTGQVFELCVACAGQGKLSRPYEIKVRIPPGVQAGEQLHVAARRGGRQAPTADLDIRVEWLPHPFFALDADGTVRCELPVNGFAWLAQRELHVPTLAGLHTLALRRDQLRYVLPGQGFPARGTAGAAVPRPDQVVLLQPVFPDAMSTAQKSMLDALIASTESDAPQALSAWQHTLAAWSKERPKAAT